MSLLEEARGRDRTPPGPPCKVQRALHHHPKQADDILAVIRDRNIPHKDAARTFAAHGIEIGVQVIAGHRNDGCTKCARAGTDLG